MFLSQLVSSELQGTRAVIVVDKEVPAALASDAWKHHEAYLVHPDRDPATGHFSQFPGDARAALAPFLAHQHLQPGSGHHTEEYEWILLGDDDTLWFMGGVLTLLQAFDHNVPSVITGEMRFCADANRDQHVHAVANMTYGLCANSIAIVQMRCFGIPGVILPQSASMRMGHPDACPAISTLQVSLLCWP